MLTILTYFLQIWHNLCLQQFGIIFSLAQKNPLIFTPLSPLYGEKISQNFGFGGARSNLGENGPFPPSIMVNYMQISNPKQGAGVLFPFGSKFFSLKMNFI